VETDTHTDTQAKYSNPRCACAPKLLGDQGTSPLFPDRVAGRPSC